MRVIAWTAVVMLAGCATPSPKQAAQADTPPAAADGTIAVRLSDFAFSPDHLHLKAGVPVRLRLVNDSGGGHDFSAPAFFAASTLRPGSPSPSNGAVEVASHQTVELALVPRTPGTYPLECSHFLHSTFGMTGSVEVAP